MSQNYRGNIELPFKCEKQTAPKPIMRKNKVETKKTKPGCLYTSSGSKIKTAPRFLETITGSNNKLVHKLIKYKTKNETKST